jgi:hypothetical protein
VNVQNLTAQLQDVYQRKVTAEKQAGDLNLAQLQHDRNQAATMLHAEGIGPDTNLKWDARAKSAEYSTNPMEAFGSFASVFAILASSFTRAPMANALNGAAAAMNAIKANDDKGYQRGYEAYKSNAELAMKRQQMQHEQYQDALELMKVDATIGQARMTATAARFGDEIVLRELQNGFNPAIEKLIEDRSNNALRMAEVLPRMEELNLKVQAVQRVQEARKGGDPGELAAAMQNLRDVQSGFSAAGARTLSPDQEFTQRYFVEHPDATPEQFGKDYDTYKAGQHQGASGSTANIPGRAQQAEINERQKEYEKENIAKGMSATEARKNAYDRASREVQMVKPPTPNQITKMQAQVDLYSQNEKEIDEALDLLAKPKWEAGLGGRVARVAEHVENVLGFSNDTDRTQFMRTIQYLRLMGGRLLTETSGRPLSLESHASGDVIGGTSLGDTKANVERSLRKVLELYAHNRQQIEKQIKGDWKSPDDESGTPAPAATPAAKPPAKNDWWSQY